MFLNYDEIITKPITQGRRILCKIIRRKNGMEAIYPQYELFLEGANNTRTFLLAARKKKKATTSTYVISKSRFDVLSDKSSVVGQVK